MVIHQAIAAIEEILKIDGSPDEIGRAVNAHRVTLQAYVQARIAGRLTKRTSSMAYLSKNLSVLAYANGFTLWHYTTPDSLHEVYSKGYFDKSAEMMRVGDMILLNVYIHGQVNGGIATIKSNDGGKVTLALMSPGS